MNAYTRLPIPIFNWRCFPSACLQHFPHGIRMMYGGNTLLMLGYLPPLPIPLAHYETLRRFTAGLIPNFELIDLTPGLQLRGNERYSYEVQQLTAHANNMISWVNDLYLLSANTSAPLRHCIEALKTWIVGHQLWIQGNTGRYSSPLENSNWGRYSVDLEAITFSS